MIEAVEWIESQGGPLILAPRSIIRDWFGNLSASGKTTDYARACAVDDVIDTISVGAHSAVVGTSSEPHRSSQIRKRAL
jgi:Immunity protein 21